VPGGEIPLGYSTLDFSNLVPRYFGRARIYFEIM
jgi:hypothetical protein